MVSRYSLQELQARPTLAVSQADDLKIERNENGMRHRYWLSRCTAADGEPYNHKVTVECLRDGKWKTLVIYAAHTR